MDFTDKYNRGDYGNSFEKLPQRIFMDTNVVQYLGEFGEFIFDGAFEDDTILLKLPYESFLYKQIVNLKKIFLGLHRTSTHFVVSEFIIEEIKRKNDERMTKWALELYAYWLTNISYIPDKIFDGTGIVKYAQAQKDSSIINGLSKDDFQVFSDALKFECDAILTCDKYRNRQTWVYEKYGIMLLYPSDYMEIIKKYQALWY